MAEPMFMEVGESEKKTHWYEISLARGEYISQVPYD